MTDITDQQIQDITRALDAMMLYNADGTYRIEYEQNNFVHPRIKSTWDRLKKGFKYKPMEITGPIGPTGYTGPGEIIDFGTSTTTTSTVTIASGATTASSSTLTSGGTEFINIY